MWLQEGLSDDLLDLYDQYTPGRLEKRLDGLRMALKTAELAA
jgi:hypothetical protein